MNKEPWNPRYRPYTPEEILALAQKHPTVKALVMEWRMGGLTWEQALMAMVCELAQEAKRYHGVFKE